MHTIKLFAGDSALLHGARITADRTVILRSDTPIQRLPTPGLFDLPETALRIAALWSRRGHRVPMTLREDLRCPCGSAYTRQSATHLSCQHCGRVWANAKVSP